MMKIEDMRGINVNTMLVIATMLLGTVMVQGACTVDGDCRHGGTCSSANSTGSVCVCTQYWTGNICQLCVSDAACLNNGTCVSNICVCTPGITTSDCSISNSGHSTFPVKMVATVGIIVCAFFYKSL